MGKPDSLQNWAVVFAWHFSVEQWEGWKQLVLPHSLISWLFSCPVKEQGQSRAPVHGRSVSLGMCEGEGWAGLSSLFFRGKGEEGEFPTLLPPPWTAGATKASRGCYYWGFWPSVISEQLERWGLEMEERSLITPKASWNLNCSLSYILSGFVVLGGIMILCWVRYQYCGSGITYSKPCWQSGITQALQLCRWEQIGCIWPKTLVEFKLVVSYFSFTRWLNIDTYIHTHRAFISRAMWV